MTVVEDLNSAFYMGYFFGLSPYTSNLELNKQLLWYSMLLILILIVYWPAEYYLAFDDNSFSIAHLVDVALLNITYISAVYKSVSNIKLLRELVGLLKKVDDISSLNCYMKKSYKLQLSLVVIVLISLFDAITAEEKLRFWEYLPFIFTLSFEDQFRQINFIFSARLDALLSLVGKTDPVKLIKSYNFLYGANKIFNTMYSVQVFCYVTSVFVFSVTEAYLLAKAYLSFSSSDTDSQIDIIVYSFNFIFRFLHVFLMCHTGSSVTRECEKFNDSIIRAMENDESDTLWKNDKIQLHIVMNYKMTFSCFGYFELNYLLLQMIASTTAVYVLIIIQFDLSCSCNGPHI